MPEILRCHLPTSAAFPPLRHECAGLADLFRYLNDPLVSQTTFAPRRILNCSHGDHVPSGEAGGAPGVPGEEHVGVHDDYVSVELMARVPQREDLPRVYRSFSTDAHAYPRPGPLATSAARATQIAHTKTGFGDSQGDETPPVGEDVLRQPPRGTSGASASAESPTRTSSQTIAPRSPSKGTTVGAEKSAAMLPRKEPECQAESRCCPWSGERVLYGP